MEEKLDNRFLESLKARHLSGEQFEFHFFWGHTPQRGLKAGEVDDSCLSQWHESSFTVDGIRYKTAEHFMMASKADLFGDMKCKQRIIESAGPREAKALGREVKGFDEAAWVKARYGIVVKGNLAKFSQNAPLFRHLESTGSRILVEASPYDKLWGIGMSADNRLAASPKHWRGLNLLGFALMHTRLKLLKDQNHEH